MQSGKELIESMKRLAQESQDLRRNAEHDIDDDKNKKKDDSDYDMDFDDDHEEARKKEQLKKEIEDKKVVRFYEESKAKGTLKMTEDPTETLVKKPEDQILDDLWLRFRHFLDDQNDKGEKREIKGRDKANRIKFLEALEEYDYEKKGIVAEFLVEKAFNRARFFNLPLKDERMKLYKSLECLVAEDDVNYRELLSAPVARETQSLNGIFPKIRPKGPSSKQVEEQKKKNEEERKKKQKLDDEEKKRKEEADKRVQLAKKSAETGYKKPSAEEEKMKEREEQLKMEKQHKEHAQKQAEEAEKVRKEISEYRRVIEAIQLAVKKTGQNLRNWFITFDQNKDGFLDYQEMKNQLKIIGVGMRDSDLEKLFEIIDLKQTGKISYNDFCDIIEKSSSISLDSIVKQRRETRGEAYISTLGLDKKNPDDSKDKNVQMKTSLADINSQSRIDQREKDLGNVDGLSSIMGRSAFDASESRALIDDNDVINVYSDIKELFKANAFTFDDLLSKMGKPDISRENQVTFKDFERLVREMPGNAKYSLQQLRQVFMMYSASGKGTINDAYIPMIEFKDKFYPGLHWNRAAPETSSARTSFLNKSETSSAFESKSESIHVDNILAGKKLDQIKADQLLEKEKMIKEKEAKYGPLSKGDNMFTIKEDKFEMHSQSSAPSKAIDDVLYKTDKDPRKAPGMNQSNVSQGQKGVKFLDTLGQKDNLLNFHMNQEYFRQNEAIFKQIPLEEKYLFDKSLDMFFKRFAKSLIDELSSGPVKRELGSYVTHYGKEQKGFLSYKEFREVYLNHIHYVDNEPSKPFNEEAKLRALFGIFDSQSTGRVAQKDFERIILQNEPSVNLIERLKNKIKKGGDRLVRVLTEEFQQAEMPYGCQGILPISNFQTIMTDYDVSMLAYDLEEFRKKALIHKDSDNNEYIRYREFLELAQPRKMISAEFDKLERLVKKIQSIWRGHQARKRIIRMKQKDYKELGDRFENLGKTKGVAVDDKKGQRGKTLPDKKGATQGKKGVEDKKKQALDLKNKRKKGETLESRMGQVIKVPKDLKVNERQLQLRKEMTDFLKNVLFDDIITQVVCYGESLDIGRDIQKKFENRPVTKFVFPMIHQFQYNVVGVQPKSLQTLNELGQILFLDSDNQLNQYDISTNKTLQQVNLGTRPPLKHYDIIDMVCDQTSGRIYTLNANWILEIWNIEQNASLPQRRLAVCTNEGNKDYISLYYKNTFNNAKPKFLSLSDHNSQILIANTSCVDGCIVFIDPISFSILKKIQLRYQDYEISRKIRDSIKKLKEIFKNIIEKSGKTVYDIFLDITSKDSQQIKIREFVQKICFLDHSLKMEDVYKLCSVLDDDGSGTISLDEFLHYFQHLEEEDITDFERKKAEEELYENIWPDWVVKQNKVEFAKQLFGRMYDILQNKHGISAEQAFGIYDGKDKGQTPLTEFKRILQIFFSEVLVNEQEIDFIINMTQKTVDQQVMYRDFCKFLNKRFIRTFRNVNASQSQISQSEGKNSHLRELDNLLKKEASINYIIRKCAELNIDLRAVLHKNDENELSVIARTRFWRILESLPLGLLPFEIDEIFENDLHFDNYGNVDYTVIVNSDIFVTLERQRLRKLQKLGSKNFDINDADQSSINKTDVDKITDNRKVVVEDLIYIDDLEIIIYTTLAPKTSNIFVTHTKKLEKQVSQTQTEVVNLSAIQKSQGGNQLEDQGQDVLPNYYQLLARLRGHKNSDPPTINYVPSSGCLISGEKHLLEIQFKPSKDTFPKAEDPTLPVSHKFQKSNLGAYEKNAEREKKGNYKSEIIIWNLQRDMVELFQTRPPWNVPIFQRFDAHNASIIDICYLPKAQLIVTSGTDQTIRFFDPVSHSYDLTDPNNIPHAQQKPGYYKPLQRETTQSNVTFKQIKGIYAGNDTSCFALKCLNIQNIMLDQDNPDFKSQIEWVIGLKLGRPQHQGKKNTQVGFVFAYGIERVKIEVPALHHDDIVPPYIIKECEDLITSRRRKLITSFQNSLPHKIEKIYSQVQLQDSYIAQIRKLFLQSILSRKDIKYVNPEPLREIYKMIVKLPNRTKFENFLATSGCSDKLSVSETFFYLQKFMQIHPLRTTQIEFEKSIEEFQQKHSREFLRGVKRWPKQSVQKFANYIRLHGLEISYLQRDSFTPDQVKLNEFCTRERFIQYFNEIVIKKDRFSSEEIDSILNELDPYFTGIIQINLIQNYFREEIHFYNLTTLNRPKQIFEDLRSKVFPNKKLALQQALTSVDLQGDGYIQKEQFIQAFQKAEIYVDRDILEFLFNVVAEKFNTVQDEGQTSNNDEKVLSITYFINKLFNQPETVELSEIDVTLQNIKAALIYKGLDFSVVFAENSVEAQHRSKKTAQPGLDQTGLDDTQIITQKAKNQPIDLTQHYSRYAQQLVKDEFCQRLEQVNAKNVSQDHIKRLSNFLSLNQKNTSIIYLNAWLHHLKRVQTAFQVLDKKILPVICSKLLRNESVFRSYVDSTGELKGKREEDKIIDVADLRSVLHKFGVTYLNQNIFVQEFARNDQIHIEDLITRMKSCVQQAYNMATSTLNKTATEKDNENQESTGIAQMEDLRKTDYFDKVQMKLKNLGSRINISELVDKMRQFDQGDTGKIKIYHFINVLKHNYPQLFENETLIGLQFELECLNTDNCVDYEEFVKIFLEKQATQAKDMLTMHEVKLDKKSTYQIQDYEDLISRISIHVKLQGLDLGRIFSIFAKNNYITYPHVKKIFDLINFQLSDPEFKLLINFADENGDGQISSFEFSNSIIYAKEIAPQFDINKWIVSSRNLDGRYQLLEKISAQSDIIRDGLISEFGENGVHSGVLTGEQFQNLLRDSYLGFSEYDIDVLTVYAIKGSRRAQSGDIQQQINVRNDLIQFYNFEKSLIPVIKQMRKEDTDKKRKDKENDFSQDEMARFRRELERKQKEQRELSEKHQDPAQRAREQQLVNKIIEFFTEREVTFFDCFQHLYDPLNPSKNIITVSQFKKAVNSLNLPLTVQEHRILRRIADPTQIGKVDLQKFCVKFETEDLRKKRLDDILEKVATSFYLQNFNLRRAFSLFDKDGDGQISQREFRQGWLTLNLGLTYDEIDDLMNMVDSDKSGSITYDEFISKMDIHIQKRTKVATKEVKLALYHKLKSLMDGNKESLYEIMMDYEYDNSGKIKTSDLLRVFKRIGILHPEPHMKTLIKAGGAQPNDETIDYVHFSQQIQKKLDNELQVGVKQTTEFMQKLYALIQSKKLSIFEFFCTVDVNLTGFISKLEFKTGIQTLGLPINTKEYENLWKVIKKPVKKIIIKAEEEKQRSRSSKKKQESDQPEIESLSYLEMLIAFVQSNCFKLEKSIDNTNNLINKFRQQLKKKNLSVEKLYKTLDPNDLKFVFRQDFINECMMQGLEFSEEELSRIFEYICQVGTKGTESTDQQKQLIERGNQKATTRFTFKQLHDAVLVKRDENWLFQSFIKIQGVILQKNLTYKRLFAQWREKNSKTQQGRLSSKELKIGLKKLRAGLTTDEIEKLISSVPFEGKDNSITPQEFEKLVVAGAKKLEQEKSYEKLMLQEWITTFNDALNKDKIPIDKLFQEMDKNQVGSLSFEEFVLMNEVCGISITKKDLKRTFDIIDRSKNGRIRLEEIRSISSLIENEELDEEQQRLQDQEEIRQNLEGEALKLRQELDDLYEALKEKLEKKNTTLESVIYEQLKYMPNQFANSKGVQQLFEKLLIILSKNEAEKILADVRKSANGRFECSFKDFIDFMTRKRINVAFFDKGFVDPLIAQCCQQMVKIISHYQLTLEKCYDIFDKERDGLINKETFMKCIQGMSLGIATEDLIEFFNYLDDKNENIISKLQFVDGITFVTSKIGGGSRLEQALSSGVQNSKKGTSLRQQVFGILKKVADELQGKRLSMRQVISVFDINKTGYISRSEFAAIIKDLETGINLDQTRMLMNFFDDKSTGKISVVEFVRSIQEILNQQTGGGVYAFMQVQPILQKIINELAIDSDKFFDEVADLNEQLLGEELKFKQEGKGMNTRASKMQRGSLIGLSKRLFYQHLQKYGVNLDEDEKTLLNTVFGMQDQIDKFDYEKMDTSFEGVQQQLYAQEAFYTVEWERRIFMKIGDFLKGHNLTINKCFNLIDGDNSQTISLDELKQAVIRFQMNITDKELKVFMSRLDEEKKGYITQQQFVKRFWSAYTYDDVFSISEKSDKKDVRGGIADRMNKTKMFSALQSKMRQTLGFKEAFSRLDSGIGFLTFKDLQLGLPQQFGITLKREEILRLFKEIDQDRDGIIKLNEFENYYNKDYNKQFKNIEKEKEHVNMQYDIFEHLIKVLKQKNLTLAEVFEQIDMNKNGFIECDEFQNLLERIGFTISEQQVYELMRQMDENFDGRISYNELKDHIGKLGFQLTQDQIAGKKKDGTVDIFQWRDKGLEVIIRVLNGHLNKKPFEDYFKKFDSDHDHHLTPSEFRMSMIAMKDQQIKKFQIERILHILIDEKRAQPVIAISKICKFFKNYSYLEKQGEKSSNILIDEDLFVYIIEKYDGFSRLVDQISQFEEKSSYIQRHVFELKLRGLDMLANQKSVEKLHRKSLKLNELFESALVLLAGEATRLMKEEAQLCVLDPQYNINTIVNDQNVGVLTSIDVPTIENSAFDIDFATLTYLPSGAQRYIGLMPEDRRKVEILIYPSEDLNYVSADGKTFKKHLQMELQVHRFLMNCQFDEYEEQQKEDENNMDIFLNIGKFEKKIGLAASDKEVYVVNELINQEEWISLDDFVERNGGILNIPLFYHTDAPLFIIRHWASKILQIIQKLHDVSIVLRCLDLKQIYVSRDGQRVKLANVRGLGKVNNLGNISSSPDIYLTLENNSFEDQYGGSSTMSPGFKAGTSSKKTDTQKVFSNRALDNPFIAPEILFAKFSEQTSALDVWSFGMIMYSILIGQKPDSFYAIYRRWYKKQHGHDIELGALPFIPPSTSNFLYDPFSIDFDNPFNAEDLHFNEDFTIPGSLVEKNDSLKFENTMKCIKNLSCSSLFEGTNSKKFHFKTVAQEIRENNNPDLTKNLPPRFAGQQNTNSELRRKVMQQFAKAEILDRKNELGLILDIISSCLDMDPKRRPTIQGLLHSPLFSLDKYELTNAVRFSQNVILYRSPQSSVSIRITAPLRAMCAIAIKSPHLLFEIEPDILKVFAYAEDCIGHISTLPIDQINDVLTEDEKRRGLMQSQTLQQFKDKDFSSLRVSPNSPLAAQIIEDKIMDMLIFITLRYYKGFKGWKGKRLTEINKETQGILKQQQSLSVSSKKKSVKFNNDETYTTDRNSQYQALNQAQLLKKKTERLSNQVLLQLKNMLRTLVYEMHSYNTPMAPYVKEVIEYIVKFYAGEEYELGSDYVLRKTSGIDSNLKDYLRGRSFFRRENELKEEFKSDNTDKLWHTEQKNKTFLDKSNYWDTELHQEALKIYKDAITESGMGQSCYPVINDYITNVTNSFEPSKVFSKQMNQLCLSFLIPMNRTALYYNELIPLTECLARLYSPTLEKAGKRCALAVVRSVFQTGSSDKIKACLDMRVPKHIIHFLQDSDSEVRHECLLTFLEISKGLQDEDFEIIGKNAANLKNELSKRAYRRTAFDQHKTLSMMSQQQDVIPKDDEQENQNASKKKRTQPQQSQADMMSTYIKRTTALIEKNDNEKFINFALDLPNLNFLSNKRFLKEMAICFESPVFIAPLIRLLKSPTESFQNKETILQILFNLFCGNERVLIAINSPACDTYMTLLKMLMQNTKIQSAKSNTSGLSAQMRSQLVLQEKVVELFRYMFEQRRPTIIRDLSCIGSSSTLLKEQSLSIPNLINLPEIIAFVDEFSQITDLRADMIIIDDFLTMLSDLRCWIKHFYAESAIPELTRIKALQRCINLIMKIVNILWADFPNNPDKRGDYLILIKTSLSLIDWLCVRGQERFIFNEQSGKYNLEFIMDKCNFALSAFRQPSMSTRVPMEELTHNTKTNKEIQKTRKYDMFPFTEIGSILQNILYQLVRKNDDYINQLLAEANFGFIFGEQLILEYDFIRHCIDNKIESMVLIDTYVKKNEIRLNTFEYLLKSNEHTLKPQFIKSNFIEKMFAEYISDFREFNIQFSKIDLEFLAFRKTFPIRLECVSIINTTLLQKEKAPSVFTELIMYARRHFLIRNEVALLRQGKIGNEESTSLLLFSIFLESNEEDLIYAMMQEGAHKVIRDMMKEYPSLNKRFPILAAFTNKF